MAMVLTKRASVGSRTLPQRLDLNRIYPCPCCQQGHLQGITLTEAFGCDRCQYIFAVSPDHLHIENLTASYPYRKLWYWSGSQWMLSQEPVEHRSLALQILIPVLILLVLVFLAITTIMEKIALPLSLTPLLILLVLGLGLGMGIVMSRRR